MSDICLQNHFPEFFCAYIGVRKKTIPGYNTHHHTNANSILYLNKFVESSLKVRLDSVLITNLLKRL